MEVGSPHVQIAPLAAVEYNDRNEVGQQPGNGHYQHHQPLNRLWVHKPSVGLHKEVETDTYEDYRIDEGRYDLKPLVAEGLTHIGLTLAHQVGYVGQEDSRGVGQVMQRIREQREAVGDNPPYDLYNGEGNIE